MIGRRVLVQLHQMRFDQRLQGGVGDPAIVVKGIFINGDGPAHAACIGTFATCAAKLRDIFGCQHGGGELLLHIE